MLYLRVPTRCRAKIAGIKLFSNSSCSSSFCGILGIIWTLGGVVVMKVGCWLTRLVDLRRLRDDEYLRPEDPEERMCDDSGDNKV